MIGPGQVGRQAIERAVRLVESNQASLKVVSVAPDMMVYSGMFEDEAMSSSLSTSIINGYAEELAALVEPYQRRIKIVTQVLEGIPFLEIIRAVLRDDHDLVIKSPDDPDFLDRIFGSDDMHLLRKCPCPVWLIKSQAPKNYRRILAAVDIDGSYPPMEMESRRRLNRQILELASSLAVADFSELHVVHAWDAIGETAMRGAFLDMPQEEVDSYVEQVRQQRGKSLKKLLSELSGEVLEYLKPKPHLVKGWARKEIPALAKEIDADLVVMGTVARTGIPGFIMGNTAETILNQLDCSVLAIKPTGFVTPVTIQD